jgi:hypothetical protein
VVCGGKISPPPPPPNPFLQLAFVYTVKRPKFGNGPLVRHPLSKLLKNHISAGTEVSDLLQRGDWLNIFFWTKKKFNNWGSLLTLYDLQQMGPSMSKLGFEKHDSVLFPPRWVNILGGLQSKKDASKIGLIQIMHLNELFSLHFL